MLNVALSGEKQAAQHILLLNTAVKRATSAQGYTSVRIECDCVVRSLAILLFGDLDRVRFDGPKAVQSCLHHPCCGADWNPTYRGKRKKALE